MNPPAPWGRYAPRGRDRLLLQFRKLGLARGPVKRLPGRLWLARHPDEPVDVVYRGLRFRLYPADNAIDAKMLFGSRQRERQELQLLQPFIAEDGVFIDIGANTGYYTLMAAAAGARRVLAIEPNPPVCERLRFNVAANDLEDRVSILALALAAGSGPARLSVARGDLGGSRIGEPGDDAAAVTVDTRPLTAVVDEAGLQHIDALKIDVEGMEDAVLFPFYRDAAPALWPRCVIIEHTSRQDWDRDILGWMTGHGYRPMGQNRSNTILRLG